MGRVRHTPRSATGCEHSAYVVLVDGSGMQRIGWPVDRLTPEGLAHDIRQLQAGRDDLGAALAALLAPALPSSAPTMSATGAT